MLLFTALSLHSGHLLTKVLRWYKERFTVRLRRKEIRDRKMVLLLHAIFEMFSGISQQVKNYVQILIMRS
jgi:hypothetical protein